MANKREKALKILADIENIKPSDTVYHRIGDKLRKVYNLLKETQDTERLNKCQWDMWAFDFYAQPGVLYKPPTRFIPMIETTKGKYPDPDKITDEMVTYYHKRAGETQNLVLKGRYLDILWEFVFSQKADEQKIQVANNLIEIQLELAKACEKYPESEILLVDSYYRAVSLCIGLNRKQQLGGIVKDINALVNFLYKQGQGRWVLDLAEVILMVRDSKSANIVSNDILKHVGEVLNKIQSDYKLEKESHLQRETLKIIKRLEQLKGDQNAVGKIHRIYADSYIEQAESNIQGNNPSYLVAAHFYELAMREYMNIGDKRRFKILKTKVREAYKKAEEHKEFKEIEVKTTIPQKAIDEFCEVFTKPAILNDSLKLLGYHPALTPNIDKIKKEVEKELKKSVAIHLFPMTPIAGDLKVGDIISEDEKYKWRLNQRLILSIKMQTNLGISKVIDTLCEKKGLSAHSLINYFENWGLMDPENVYVTEIGFERYFAGDYVSTIYILVPQFESSLRRLLLKGDVDITSFKTGRFKERTLADLLFQGGVRKLLGEDLTEYISVVMVEPTGLNLRNNVAHGLLTRSECTRELADIVLHLFLVLTRFSLPKGKKQGE